MMHSTKLTNLRLVICSLSCLTHCPLQRHYGDASSTALLLRALKLARETISRMSQNTVNDCSEICKERVIEEKKKAIRSMRVRRCSIFMREMSGCSWLMSWVARVWLFVLIIHNHNCQNKLHPSLLR